MESKWQKRASTSPPDGIFEWSLNCVYALVMLDKRNTLKLRPGLVFPLTDLRANDCLCGRRSWVNQIRKHISNAGLLLLYVLGIVFILLPAKGPFRQRQVSCHTEIGGRMAHPAVDWLLVGRHQHPFIAVLWYCWLTEYEQNTRLHLNFI